MSHGLHSKNYEHSLLLINRVLTYGTCKRLKYKPKWCSTEYRTIKKNKFITGRRQYRYDFLITLKNNKTLIIELDGEQHFIQVSNWKTPFEQQIKDKYKEFKSRQHNIPLVRCLQVDVYKDCNNWDTHLQNAIDIHLKK